jgi:hypothetical protein
MVRPIINLKYILSLAPETRYSVLLKSKRNDRFRVPWCYASLAASMGYMAQVELVTINI